VRQSSTTHARQSDFANTHARNTRSCAIPRAPRLATEVTDLRASIRNRRHTNSFTRSILVRPMAICNARALLDHNSPSPTCSKPIHRAASSDHAQHGVPVRRIGIGNAPLHLLFLEVPMSRHRQHISEPIRDLFDVPDLTEPTIRAPTHIRAPVGPGEARGAIPAQRVDYSLHRCHLPATSPSHFRLRIVHQLPFYIDGLSSRRRPDGERRRRLYRIVEPGNVIISAAKQRRSPELEATSTGRCQHTFEEANRRHHHGQYRCRPANAKTITTYPVLSRTHGMLGHCAGLPRHPGAGDYVLAHGYVRSQFSTTTSRCGYHSRALARSRCARGAVAEVTGLSDRLTAHGAPPVASIDNRNWELPTGRSSAGLSQSARDAPTWNGDNRSQRVSASACRYGRCCAWSATMHRRTESCRHGHEFYKRQVAQHLPSALGRWRSCDMPMGGSLRKLRNFSETAS